MFISQVAQEDKVSTPGLKRTLSEGYEEDEQTIKKELKRPKVEREELEAQLELKITAKAGSHHKLEKVCMQPSCCTDFSPKSKLNDDFAFLSIYSQIVQQLVDERLRALQVTIFDKHFKELKDRVDKIDCAVKHQTVINTLQVSRWQHYNAFLFTMRTYAALEDDLLLISTL